MPTFVREPRVVTDATERRTPRPAKEQQSPPQADQRPGGLARQLQGYGLFDTGCSSPLAKRS